MLAVGLLRDTNPAVFQGVDDGGGAVVDRKLFEDRCNVIFHSLVADFELFGDLFVATAVGDMLQDLDLAGREWGDDTLSIRF